MGDDMRGSDKKEGKTSKLRGCLTAMVIGIGILILVIWQMGEPGRRALAVHDAIHSSMSLEDVEGLLTGRYLCLYQIKTDDQWHTVSRTDFLQQPGVDSSEAPSDRRIQLHFMGMSPGRTSFSFRFDASERVLDVSQPGAWD